MAQQAQVWLTGSLNGRGWDEAAPLGWTLLAVLPCVIWAARAQRSVDLDDDTATVIDPTCQKRNSSKVAASLVNIP